MRAFRSRAKQVPSEHAGQPDLVLVVEHDAFVRASMTRELREAGFGVVECENGVEALERISDAYLERRHFALIIADADCPVRNGLQLFADVRQLDWETPLILIASAGDRVAHREAKRLGVHTVIDRPLQAHVLRAVARAAIPPPW